jgi:uncharacterized protein (TIGR02145 family)
MVYHTGENNIPAGIYIWNGGRWVPPGGDDPNILYDAEMNDYTTGDFGTAGVWMTQNLRTTEKYYADINENLTLNDAASTTKPYYTYPRPAGVTGSDIDTAFYAHEDYGLLYNWVAASGRINVSDDERNTDHARHQGICPTGWHLPSDKEWYQLETEIAGSAAGVYSTTGPVSTTSTLTGWRGEHGGKMKSTIPVNNQDSKGTSHSRESNGFDALLVGGSDGASYGLSISFWASSSGNSNDASYRVLRNSDAQVNVGNYAKTAPRSVRCKKDD